MHYSPSAREAAMSRESPQEAPPEEDHDEEMEEPRENAAGGDQRDGGVAPAELLPMILQIFRNRRQTGSTNDALVNHMVSSGSVIGNEIEAAFRAVDRGKFIPDIDGSSGAYDDSPIRSGRFHMSQPSLYADALAALQLAPGHSFLNVGVGTGYLSSIVAEITGESMHHGVDVHEDVLEHARAMLKEQGKSYVKLFQVNVHDVDIAKSPRYERIYLGACAGAQSKQILDLLEIGGILVGPFSTTSGQYIRRVIRRSPTKFEIRNLKSVQFGNLVRSEDDAEKFALPSPVWTPESNRNYPKAFRRALMEVLFCTTREESPIHIVPREILVDHVFGYVHPRWFDVPEEGPSKEVFEDGAERDIDNDAESDEEMRLRSLHTLRTVAGLAHLGAERGGEEQRLTLDQFMIHLLRQHPHDSSEEEDDDEDGDARMRSQMRVEARPQVDEPAEQAGQVDAVSDTSDAMDDSDEQLATTRSEPLTPNTRGARELVAMDATAARRSFSRGCQAF